MQIGDEVSITEGPLAGLAGRITGFAEQRVVVSVHVDSGLVDAEMDSRWVSRKAPIRKPVSRDEPDIWFRSQQT